MSTLRALDSVENQAHNRITRETISRAHNRADDLTDEEQIGPSQLDTGDQDVGESSTLNSAERFALYTARPTSRGVVFKTPAPVTPEEPLPADFTPAPVPDYVSEIVTLDPAEEAAIKAEADAESAALLARMYTEVQAEIAADKEAARVSFAAKLAAQAKPAPVLTEVEAPLPSPMSEHETLRLAVLAS